MSAWWCEHVWTGAGPVQRDVLVTVAGGRITAVLGGVPRPPGTPVLRGLVVPGLANAHSHAFHRLLRARTQQGRGSFWTWRELMYRAADRLTPDLYREVATAVFAEMALAGVTGVGEFHYLHHAPGGRRYADPNAMGLALADAARTAGLRLTLLDTCYLTADVSGAPVVGTQERFSDGSSDAWAARVDDLHAALSGVDGVVVGAAVHSVRAVPPSQLPAVVEWATARGAPLHAHVAEQTAEVDACRAVHGATPVELLAEHGVLGPRTTAVHATHLTASDVEALRSSGTGVCFCPTTERDLGDGIGPAPALLAEPAVPLSLGSDSHAVIDLLEEARAVELDERLARRERGVLDAETLLACATRHGHRSLGSDAGTIAPGARADLVALDLASVRTAGGGATVETAVFAAGAADVTDVVVDGRIVVADRRHTTVPDVAGRLAAVTSSVLDGGSGRAA
ncbi:formimidoylglutamate deiminase [Actinomycetospora sp. OC33-EN08]|uniref:Formimidoylglutamate deiminase n=1 Tax=Actinomycetospora aurantiaca TaxID=3129233 RepID=A0ABU8MP09_9PSEU